MEKKTAKEGPRPVCSLTGRSNRNRPKRWANQVVVANETKTEFDGDVKLRWRLHDEFHAFPRQMGWWKLVNLNAPTPAAAAQARAKAGEGTAAPDAGEATAATAAVAAGSSQLQAELAKLDLGMPGVRLAVPALAKQGNVVEVKRGCFSLRGARVGCMHQ